jgi:hypothetical protein
MEKTRRNRIVAVLGAGGVLATVLSAAGPAALAQPAFARAPALKVCPAIEALVSDGVSGPGLGGEVLRVNPGGQSTLTTNTSPPGAPRLDAPSDMAFRLCSCASVLSNRPLHHFSGSATWAVRLHDVNYMSSVSRLWELWIVTGDINGNRGLRLRCVSQRRPVAAALEGVDSTASPSC